MPKKSDPNIVVIGGGTGSFTLLSSLKNQAANITALVNMADDGGSTGVLRDELGVLPPGDVRQCLVALSDSSQSLRELFNYRFPKKTSFAGHSFGNLFLSAVEMMTKDFNEAVSMAGEVLQIRGRVLPITLDNCHLVYEGYGGTVKGEFTIANLDMLPGEKPQLSLQPNARLNPAASVALQQADLIVIAPGNLYGSLAPALLVDGLADALTQARAKVVYVCNLVNKPIQTKDYGVHDYVAELERFIGGAMDYVLYNTDKPTPEVLAAYALDGEFPVMVDQAVLAAAPYTAIGANFLAHSKQEHDANDTFIMRSLIRHDADAVAAQLMKLVGHEV